MRHTVLAAIFALSASAVFSFGCGAGASPSANSFTEVYTKTIQPSCSNNFCHYNLVDYRYGQLDLSSKVRAYWSLVDLPCMGFKCLGTGMRVLPGQPDSSIMYQKLSAPSPCGTQMPADTTNYSTNGTSDLTFSGPGLQDEDKQRIREWIQEGAQDN
jgi:hypothetical protein